MAIVFGPTLLRPRIETSDTLIGMSSSPWLHPGRYYSSVFAHFLCHVQWTIFRATCVLFLVTRCSISWPTSWIQFFILNGYSIGHSDSVSGFIEKIIKKPSVFLADDNKPKDFKPTIKVEPYFPPPPVEEESPSGSRDAKKKRSKDKKANSQNDKKNARTHPLHHFLLEDWVSSHLVHFSWGCSPLDKVTFQAPMSQYFCQFIDYALTLWFSRTTNTD